MEPLEEMIEGQEDGIFVISERLGMKDIKEIGGPTAASSVKPLPFTSCSFMDRRVIKEFIGID